jgi:hypothetical protein
MDDDDDGTRKTLGSSKDSTSCMALGGHRRHPGYIDLHPSLPSSPAFELEKLSSWGNLNNNLNSHRQTMQKAPIHCWR